MTKRPDAAQRRAAQYLADHVGEGNVFTTAMVRGAVPEAEQTDRRVRELRSVGWRIDTYLEDRSLKPNERRLVEIGERIWLT